MTYHRVAFSTELIITELLRPENWNMVTLMMMLTVIATMTMMMMMMVTSMKLSLTLYYTTDARPNSPSDN